ncbi:transglutaminase domain-containing protein [Spirochaetales bacterium NM-380-WT-3C1]|uniref:Transglutaminase domain-containing protein n=1 Tax=Bullifex porci TaxID=2606638 RepID=A0A7X2PD05_9SPIO|nr:transglutaminase-like domain-containing protein [Bullifex porci]MSU06130.1 transglutaminase domain-containing protein [Bullifex porci]
MSKRIKVFLVFAILINIIVLSTIFYFSFTDKTIVSYLQNPKEIYILEAGILKNNLITKDGSDISISYDYDSEALLVLKEKYKLEKIAGSGSNLDKALNVMNEFAPRLKHKSDYDNSITIEALPLLEYSLDNKEHGINCKNKAQILLEMLLSLGIPTRKVWIMPYSPYDIDCHVVNEIWDDKLDKWVMLDITNNEYWIDENKTPLSCIEIRENGANMEFCTPIHPFESMEDLEKLQSSYYNDFLYIMKNLVYLEYRDKYGVGEQGNPLIFIPSTFSTNELVISRKALEHK